MMIKRNKIMALMAGVALTVAIGSPISAYATVEGDQTPLTDEEIASSIANGEVLNAGSVPMTVGTDRDYAVKTIGGSNRYHTSAVEARSAFSSSQWIIVASGAGYADSICAAGLAGALNCPIVLTEPGALTDTTAAVIRDLGVRDVILLGSETVASSSVQASLEGIVGRGHVTRLFGQDRYSTSRVINDYAVANLGFTWDGAALTSGRAPYDALGGGAVQGSKRSVLALSDEGSPKDPVSSPLGGKPSRVTFFGDQVIYSMAYKTKMALAMGLDLTDIQGFRVYVDAGHGWNDANTGVFDPGAIGVNGYREADFTKELANLVAAKLRAKGIDCFVNDDGGWYKLRNAEANNLNCGLMVSIHFNSGPGRGFESYIHSVNAASGSQSLQRSIHSRLAPALGITDRGVKSAQFAVCSGRVPATLLEIAFINNQSDMNAYMAKKDQAAEAIASGIAAL